MSSITEKLTWKKRNYPIRYQRTTSVSSNATYCIVILFPRQNQTKACLTFKYVRAILPNPMRTRKSKVQRAFFPNLESCVCLSENTTQLCQLKLLLHEKFKYDEVEKVEVKSRFKFFDVEDHKRYLNLTVYLLHPRHTPNPTEKEGR